MDGVFFDGLHVRKVQRFTVGAMAKGVGGAAAQSTRRAMRV